MNEIDKRLEEIRRKMLTRRSLKPIIVDFDDDIPFLLEVIDDLRARLRAQGQQPHPDDPDEPVAGTA